MRKKDKTTQIKKIDESINFKHINKKLDEH